MSRAENPRARWAHWPIQRRLLLIGSLLWLVAVSALVWWWWTRPYTPEEIVAGAVPVGTSIDIVGYVRPTSIVSRGPDSIRFELATKDSALRVHIQDWPQNMALAGMRVRVHGVLVDDDAVEAVQMEMLENEP